MSEKSNISVSKCEIEFLENSKQFRGKPVSDRKNPTEQVGKLSTFRVTSTDELNLIVGLIEWPNDPPEVRPIDLLGGLQKHNELENRGSISLRHSQDGNWLAPLNVLKFSQAKKYFTLHGATEAEIDSYLGHSFKEFLLEAGALRVGSRAAIDGETSRVANQLAVVVEPGDIQTLAIAYTVTRPLAVINDFGLDL